MKGELLDFVFTRTSYSQIYQGSTVTKNPCYISTGTIPGSPIQLIQKSPSCVFQVGQTQFAVDEGMAREIYVRLEYH